MGENKKSINFFTRLKYSIFDLERYTLFLEEKLSVGIKYFLILILIISIFISAAQTGVFMKMLNKGYNYFVNEMPDFKYQDSKLKFSQNVEAYDEEYDFYLFVDTDENLTENKLKEYKDKVYNSTNGMIILNNKLIYIVPGNTAEYDFETIAKEYNITEFNKEEFLKEYNNIGTTSLMYVYFFTSLLGMFLANVITITMDIIVLTLFGVIAARMTGIKITSNLMARITIHAITLPLLITGIHSTVYILTGFSIKYYNVMYLLISYVYIVAAIMILKSDLIKQREELIKIEEVRKEVKKELEEEELELERKDKKKKEEKDKDKTEEENEDTGINAEPDGSEI